MDGPDARTPGRYSEVMGPVVVTLALALLVALGVVVLSALVAAGGAGGLRRQLAETRAGLRRGPRESWQSAVLDDDDEEGTVDDVFAVGRPDPVGYVDADELADALQRAGSAVVGGVAQVTHRIRR